MHHINTDHILLMTDRCNACGSCIEACPKEVLGQVKFLRHQHTHVDQAEKCIGCLKCVNVCQQKAIIDLRSFDNTDAASAVSDMMNRRRHHRGHRMITKPFIQTV